MLVYKDLNLYISEVEKYWFSTRRLWFLVKSKNQINWEWKFLEAMNKWELLKSEYSFEEYYKIIFKIKQPKIIPVFFAANFWVSKWKIKNHNINFYRWILENIPNHYQPEEAHFLERLRFVIFNKKVNFHYLQKIIMNPIVWLFLKLKNIF